LKKNNHKTIPQHQPIFDKSDAEAVYNVIKSGWVSEGSETKKFQENFRKFVGTKYAIATTSGTTAIFLSLVGSGIKPGDEVIIPNMTYVATANAVRLAGAKPILTEIDPENFTISIESVKKNISKKTFAVIPVHLNGRSGDLDELYDMSKKNGFRIVEDASQALGSKYKTKFLGSIGDVGAFSLAPTKIITTGQGGIITTNNFKIYDKIRKMKDQGRYNKKDHHPIIGYNFKFTDIQAALGNSQFSKLRSRLKQNKKNHKIYYELLSKSKSFTIPISRKENQLWYFDILVKKRKLLVRFLEKSNILVKPFLKPLNHHISLGSKKKFPISDKICFQGVYLPSSSNLKKDEIDCVCKKINSFYC